MFRSIARFPYGEAVLWLFFLGFTLQIASEMGSGDTATMAAVSALAAIGVRATRRERPTDAK